MKYSSRDIIYGTPSLISKKTYKQRHGHPHPATRCKPFAPQIRCLDIGLDTSLEASSLLEGESEFVSVLSDEVSSASAGTYLSIRYDKSLYILQHRQHRSKLSPAIKE